MGGHEPFDFRKITVLYKSGIASIDRIYLSVIYFIMNDHIKIEWMSRLSWFNTVDFETVLQELIIEEENGATILPPFEDMLNAYSYVPVEDVRVVILGQDPYPTPGHAHGLAFSVQPTVTPLPRSLQNIYTELGLDYGQTPDTGCLEGWAKQGVMLLNTSLSVRSGEAGSHSNLGWSGLIKETLQVIAKETKHTVFILWGKNAQGKRIYIPTRNHLILSSAHPSPLSANRGFFGSRPFTKTNSYLQKHGRGMIDWGVS